jgi:putative peptidoglycan lipid II flippase
VFKPRSYRSAIRFTTVFMVLGKITGYLRELLTAYFFGVSRQLDIYFMAFAMATIATFPFKSWFDQIVVPRLIQTQEADGEKGFRELSAGVFSFSLALAVAVVAGFFLLLPVAIWIMAQGFSGVERQDLRGMGLLFLPWMLLYLPYCALAAVFKSLRYYDLVLAGEFCISITSVIALFFWHPSPGALPLVMMLGYVVALSLFLVKAGPLIQFWGKFWTTRMRPLYRNFFELFGASQLASLSSVVDRILQSHLPSGAISALGYAYNAVLHLGDVLSFKELYIVPLSSQENRSAKLQRLVMAGLYLTIPIALFAAFNASQIIRLLYQYGRFDGRAEALTAAALAILVFNLVSGAAGGPLLRLFQIVDRVKYTAAYHLFTAVSMALFGYLFVFAFRMQLVGMAWTIVVTSFLSVILAYAMLRRTDVKLDLRPLARHSISIALASGIAVALARLIPDLSLTLATLAVRGAVFAAVIGGFYFLQRETLRWIFHGDPA